MIEVVGASFVEDLPHPVSVKCQVLAPAISPPFPAPEPLLPGEADEQVWQAAPSVNRFLITQDLDFSDMRLYTPGTHGGLLLVRLAQPGRDALVVVALCTTESVDQWHGCLVVATDNKVRVKRPA